MSISRRTKVASLIILLVLVSMVVGFFIGAAAANAIAKRKDNPVFWKKTAMKQLEKLHPTNAQRKIFEARVDSASKDMVAIRKDVVARVHAEIAKAIVDIEKELTPEQREILEKLKPKDVPEEEKEKAADAK